MVTATKSRMKLHRELAAEGGSFARDPAAPAFAIYEQQLTPQRSCAPTASKALPAMRTHRI